MADTVRAWIEGRSEPNSETEGGILISRRRRSVLKRIICPGQKILHEMIHSAVHREIIQDFNLEDYIRVHNDRYPNRAQNPKQIPFMPMENSREVRILYYSDPKEFGKVNLYQLNE